MSKTVLIDGENFIHKVVHILKENNLIRSRDEILNFKIMSMLERVLEQSLTNDDSVNYYAAKVKMVKSPVDLASKTSKMIEWNSYWVQQLINQNIQYIKSGNLQVRDGRICQKCGFQTKVLQEKGVDVRLSVDLLLAADGPSDIVVISSDSDILPAVRAAQKKGADVTYVGFEFMPNLALTATCNRTKTFTESQVVTAFKEGNHG